MYSERADEGDALAVVEDDFEDEAPAASALHQTEGAPLVSRRAGLLAGLRSLPGALRPIAIIAVFAIGIAGGVFVYGVANPAPPPLPWPAIPAQSEPRAAHLLAAAIASNDATTVATILDPNILTTLGDALTPIVDVTDVKFTGAVNADGEQFAGYLVHGRDDQGTDTIVGFVIHVKNGAVVGVNS